MQYFMNGSDKTMSCNKSPDKDCVLEGENILNCYKKQYLKNLEQRTKIFTNKKMSEIILKWEDIGIINFILQEFFLLKDQIYMTNCGKTEKGYNSKLKENFHCL